MWVRDLDQAARKKAVARGRILWKPQSLEQQNKNCDQKGLQRLGKETDRYGLLFIPDRYSPETPAPLAILLHGAGGNAQQGLGFLTDLAERDGILLLGVDSRESTWDVIMEGYGPDVAVIEETLEYTSTHFSVDREYIAIGGFSDGASYALSLGLINGDIFSHILAFSPGFMAPTEQHGEPRIFISHGTQDPVLPIDRCSRKITPQLEHAGYSLQYHEFSGGHTVPDQIIRESITWFLKDRSE